MDIFIRKNYVINLFRDSLANVENFIKWAMPGDQFAPVAESLPYYLNDTAIGKISCRRFSDKNLQPLRAVVVDFLNFWTWKYFNFQMHWSCLNTEGLIVHELIVGIYNGVILYLFSKNHTAIIQEIYSYTKYPDNSSTS